MGLLGRAITSMEDPPPNLGELRQALLDKWAEIPVEHLQCLAASMPRRLAVIIAVRGGNTWYWPSMHKTTSASRMMQKNRVCLTGFTTITIEWHLGMLMQQIYPISINVITNLPKYTLNKIMYTVHRKNIYPANQPAFRLHKQIEYE